jgi:hypothetical protein
MSWKALRLHAGLFMSNAPRVAGTSNFLADNNNLTPGRASHD